MDLDINKLINSDFEMLKKLGWLLYHREDQNGGLNLEEIHNLLSIVTVGAIEKVYENGFSDGISEAISGH